MIADIEHELGEIMPIRGSEREQSHGPVEVSADEDGISIGIGLAASVAPQIEFNPFVVDLGSVGWIQCSANGRRLSVAMSPSMKPVGVALIGAVLRSAT